MLHLLKTYILYTYIHNFYSDKTLKYLKNLYYTKIRY